MTTYDGSTLPLFAGLTWSPEARPARLPASPGSGEGTKTSGGSGTSTCESCEASVPHGCWRRTYRDSLASVLAGWTGYSMSWRRRATPAKRSLWALTTRALRTSGSASGSWPTPKAHGGTNNGGPGQARRNSPPLSVAVMWPTPQTVDTKRARPLRKKVDRQTRSETPGSYRGDLADYVSMWPTPSATPYGSSNNGRPGDGREAYATAGKPSLERAAKWPTPRGKKGVPDSGPRKGGTGTDLGYAVKRWPTPTAGDAAAAGNRNLYGSKAHPGVSLTDPVSGGQAPRRGGPRDSASPRTGGSRRGRSRGQEG